MRKRVVKTKACNFTGFNTRKRWFDTKACIRAGILFHIPLNLTVLKIIHVFLHEFENYGRKEEEKNVKKHVFLQQGSAGFIVFHSRYTRVS